MDATTRSPFTKPQSFLLDPHAQDHGAAALYESLGFHHHIAFGSNREIALRRWIEERLCDGWSLTTPRGGERESVTKGRNVYEEAFRSRLAAADVYVQSARRESDSPLLRSDKVRFFRRYLKNDSMNCASFIECLEDFEVCPKLLARWECAAIFAEIVSSYIKSSRHDLVERCGGASRVLSAFPRMRQELSARIGDKLSARVLSLLVGVPSGADIEIESVHIGAPLFCSAIAYSAHHALSKHPFSVELSTPCEKVTLFLRRLDSALKGKEKIGMLPHHRCAMFFPSLLCLRLSHLYSSIQPIAVSFITRSTTTLQSRFAPPCTTRTASSARSRLESGHSRRFPLPFQLMGPRRRPQHPR